MYSLIFMCFSDKTFLRMYHISSAKRRKCPFIALDLAEFTDEEGYGKYLDLHECYEKFINLKGIEVE